MTSSAHPATVTVTDTALEVRDWASDDRAVMTAATAAAQRGEDMTHWFTNVVLAGTSAVTAAGTGSELARIDDALDRLDHEVRKALSELTTRLEHSLDKATHPTHGDVAKATQAAIDRLAFGVQNVLTGPDALLPAASAKAVAQVTDSALSEIHRLLNGDRKELGALIAADRERTAVEFATAISAQNQHLSQVVEQMRTALTARAVTEAQVSSGPRKGLLYEEAALAMLHDVASAAGDGGAESIGTSAGVDGSRKGDILVELRSLPTRPRLVLECKQRPGKALSAPAWGIELEHALESRRATTAIGLCPPSQLPGNQRVLVIDSRRLVVGWEPEDGDDLVTAAYLLMRMTAAQQGRESSLSPTEIEEHVRAIAAGMAPLDEIQKQAAACRRSAEKITQTAQSLRVDLAARIDTIQARLQEAA